MGQQQQQTAVAGSSAAVRRIVLVLLVAALMATIMAASAMPAMAKNSEDQGPGHPPTFSGGGPKTNANKTVVFHCRVVDEKGAFVAGPVHDSGQASC